MKVKFSRICLVAVAASLAACTTGYSDRGSDVTRFHLNQPIARGPIAIEPTLPQDAQTLEFRSYADAVARQLARLGWTVVNTVGQSEQVATVHVERGVLQSHGDGSGVNVGVGGSTGGYYGSGVGVGVGFDLGGGRPRELVGTLLEVRIKRRSDGTVFWEGRADTEAPANRPESQPAVAVEKLAEALFRDFPGESGRTIRAE